MSNLERARTPKSWLRQLLCITPGKSSTVPVAATKTKLWSIKIISSKVNPAKIHQLLYLLLVHNRQPDKPHSAAGKAAYRPLVPWQAVECTGRMCHLHWKEDIQLPHTNLHDLSKLGTCFYGSSPHTKPENMTIRGELTATELLGVMVFICCSKKKKNKKSKAMLPRSHMGTFLLRLLLTLE